MVIVVVVDNIHLAPLCTRWTTCLWWWGPRRWWLDSYNCCWWWRRGWAWWRRGWGWWRHGWAWWLWVVWWWLLDILSSAMVRILVSSATPQNRASVSPMTASSKFSSSYTSASSSSVGNWCTYHDWMVDVWIRRNIYISWPPITVLRARVRIWARCFIYPRLKKRSQETSLLWLNNDIRI